MQYVLYILNLLDLSCTLYALKAGAMELNPFMQNVPIMIIYKVFVVGALCYWLGKRTEKTARFGMVFLEIMYSLVAVWHLSNILVYNI